VPEPTKRRVQLMPSGRQIDAVEIAPGEYIADLPPSEIPVTAIVRMVRRPDGSYLPQLKVCGPTMKLGEDTPQKLGLGPIKVRVLHRLARAGFFEVVALSPKLLLLDLTSFFAHLEAARDPEFWTDSRRARFAQAVAEIK
jgi:hypothetical protein